MSTIITEGMGENMNQYKLVYEDGKEIVVNGSSVSEIVRKYDLASRTNIGTKIIQL